jgi:hypothetical protein
MIFSHKFVYKYIKKYLNYFQFYILKTFWYKYHYLSLNIDYDKVVSNLDISDLDIRVLNYCDFNRADHTVFNSNKMQVYKKRFNDKNYVAYGVFVNERLIYSTWISFKKLGLPIYSNYHLPAGAALLEDSYCHPSYRGQGLHSKMNLFRLKEIFEYGKKKAIAIVLEGNEYAFRVQRKSGFTDLGCFYAGKVLGIPFSSLNKEKFDSR